MHTKVDVRVLRAAMGAVLSLAATSVAAAPKSETYAAFAKENDAAMAKMMMEMEVKPTGDVDVDFVAMMIPHHQGAIDMAQAVLKYGHNERLKTLARGIVAQQTKEIAIMRAAVGPHIPTAAPAQPHQHMMQ